jgi:N-acetylneuraminic acid mutarotase
MKKIILRIIVSTAFSAFVINANSQSSWIQKANLSALGGRYAASAFSLGHYGYIGCGITSGGQVNDFWRWNQDSNTWTAVASYPGSGKVSMATFTIGGKGYFCAGKTGATNYADLWEYDSTTNSWTQKASFPGLGRFGAFAFVIGTNAYVGCGEPGGTPYYSDVYKYNSITNTWSAVASFPGGGRAGLAQFTMNGYGYAGCGTNGTTGVCDMWKYNPTADSWTSVAALPIPSGKAADVTTFVIDSLAYVGTGNNTTGQLYRDFWSYSATTNAWTAIKTLTGVARYDAVAFTIRNRGYVGTGFDSVGDYLTDYWVYSPTGPTGINSITAKSNNITVYPNPNNGNFTIQLSGVSAQSSVVEIYNAIGQEVYTGLLASDNNNVELTSKATGVYLYRIISENGNLLGQGRLVIQK